MLTESNTNTQPGGSGKGTTPNAGNVSDANVQSLFIADASALRSDTYLILARLLRETLDAELLDQLAHCDADTESGSALGQAWSDLADSCRNAEVESLDREFHALFIGLGRGEVLPYSSWYMSGFLLDKPLANLREDLNRLGIERDDSVTESEDHAAALFEAMALLLDPEEGVDQAEQKQFFDRHLRPWIGQFFTDLQGAKNADFYRSVAKLGEAFIEFEQSWLSLPQ